MKKLACLCLSSLLLFSFAFGVTGCSEEAAPIITSESATYEDLKAKVDLFDSVYAYYCYEKQDELNVTSGEGFTPLGTPCSYTYVTNIEGINAADSVKSCTLEVQEDDGAAHVDEYYAIDVNTLFIARTTVPADGSLGTVDKYIISHNVCYAVSDKDSTLTLVDKPDTLDFYLSFSEIMELYGTAAAQ